MGFIEHADLLSATVTILALLLYVYMSIRVGNMRTKHKIMAPSVVGHPEFERAYRVQMNTVEQLVVFVPALWLATTFFTRVTWLPAAVGFLWVVGRALYMQSYMADPDKRGPGAMITGISGLTLILLSIAGVVMSWIAIS